MRKRKSSEVPASLSRVERKFAAWRKDRTAGQRIPPSLWDSATEVAMEHGVSRTALLLKLDYYSLKKRVENASYKGPGTFVVDTCTRASRPEDGPESDRSVLINGRDAHYCNNGRVEMVPARNGTTECQEEKLPASMPHDAHG